MEQRTGALYLEFDSRRKKLEALQADQEDEADLKALEKKGQKPAEEMMGGSAFIHLKYRAPRPDAESTVRWQ